MARLAASVTAADTELRTISERALACLKVEGVHADLVLRLPRARAPRAPEARVSISRRDYAPADEPVGDRNLVTVDLSPLLEARRATTPAASA